MRSFSNTPLWPVMLIVAIGLVVAIVTGHAQASDPQDTPQSTEDSGQLGSEQDDPPGNIADDESDDQSTVESEDVEPIDESTEPSNNEPDEPGDESNNNSGDESAEEPGDELVVEQPAFFVNVKVNHADGRYQEHQKLSVQFQVERESFVYLLYHQADGKCLLLYPNMAQRENQLAAGQEVVIPSPEEAFRFRVRPPFGKEALQVLASTEPIEELTSLLAEATGAPVVSEAVLGGLGKRITSEPGKFAEHRVRIETRQAAPLPTPRQAKRVGLFIGVNLYQDPEFCLPHEEFRRSAQRMGETMTKLGGIAPEHCKVIVGEQSTKANIEAAIVNWLPSVSEPGDTVFIFYAGHGGRVRNLDGSEPDGMDELMTTYDNESGEVASEEAWDAWLRTSMILDDTLARWLQELPGRQIVLMLDTCHGGGAVDAKGLARFFVDESQRVKDISQLNTIVVTGCGPDESVWFSTGEENELWMSFFFRQAMTALPRPVTLRQAYERLLQGTKEVLEKYEIPGAQLPTLTDRVLLPVYLVP